jgi:hypothetical protein
MSFFLSLMFSLQQNQRRGRWNRFCLEAGVWQQGCGGLAGIGTMYTHVSKYKNDKIKSKNINQKRKNKERKCNISTALSLSRPRTAAELQIFTTYILYMTAPVIQSQAYYT